MAPKDKKPEAKESKAKSSNWNELKRSAAKAHKEEKQAKAALSAEEEALFALEQSELVKITLSAQAEAADNLDKAQRAMAELANVQKRAERDVSHAHKYAMKGPIEKLLPVVDSLERAMESHANDAAFLEGVQLTYKSFIEALASMGVVQLNPMGEVFNPDNHEAISMQPQAGIPANQVLQVLQKGYILNGRLIRPARVVVAA